MELATLEVLAVLILGSLARAPSMDKNDCTAVLHILSIPRLLLLCNAITAGCLLVLSMLPSKLFLIFSWTQNGIEPILLFPFGVIVEHEVGYLFSLPFFPSLLFICWM